MSDELAQIVVWVVIIIGVAVGITRGRQRAAERAARPLIVSKATRKVKSPPRVRPRGRRHLIDASKLTPEDLDEMERLHGTAGTRPEDYQQ